MVNSQKKSWVQGTTGISQYSWTTRQTVDLGKNQVHLSFIVIPECPYPLLGRDLLTKIRTQIVFSEKGVLVTDQDNHPVQVLTLQLHDEYRLFQNFPVRQDMSVWLSQFPKAWAETGGMGLVVHRRPRSL